MCGTASFFSLQEVSAEYFSLLLVQRPQRYIKKCLDDIALHLPQPFPRTRTHTNKHNTHNTPHTHTPYLQHNEFPTRNLLSVDRCRPAECPHAPRGPHGSYQWTRTCLRPAKKECPSRSPTRSLPLRPPSLPSWTRSWVQLAQLSPPPPPPPPLQMSRSQWRSSSTLYRPRERRNG